ncbi:MAG TPA: extracellular solute-binding protein, partial [Acidimicrobiia bacterium]
FFEHWMAKAGRLFVDQRNGRQGRATKTLFDNTAGRSIFAWLAGMVKDGLATTNPWLGTGSFDDLLGIRNGSHAMAIDTSAALATAEQALAAGNDPNVELEVAPMPGPVAAKGGILNQGGELFMVNKSKPEKQAAAWQFLKFLDDPAQQTAWAIGTGYLPIRKASAASPEMKDYWAKNPTYKVAFDQLVGGVNSAVTAGSVIGNFKGARDAVQDAENSMFLEGKDPKTALKTAADSATTAMKDYNTRLGG